MEETLGQRIYKRVNELGITKIEFAKRINKHNSTVSDIFQRDTLDVHLLMQISEALDYNFFAHYTKSKEVLCESDVMQFKKNLMTVVESIQKINKSISKIEKRLSIIQKGKRKKTSNPKQKTSKNI